MCGGDGDVGCSGGGDVGGLGGEFSDGEVGCVVGVEDEGAAVEVTGCDGGSAGGGEFQPVALDLGGLEVGGGGEADAVEVRRGDVEVGGVVAREADVAGRAFDVQGLSLDGDLGLPVGVGDQSHGVGAGLGVVDGDGCVAVDGGKSGAVVVVGDGLAGMLYFSEAQAVMVMTSRRVRRVVSVFFIVDGVLGKTCVFSGVSVRLDGGEGRESCGGGCFF